MEDSLRIEDAVVHFAVKTGTVKAVDHVTAVFKPGEITGIIGESGCGKSVLGMAILGLLPAYAKTEGAIWLGGQNLLKLKAGQHRRLRGRKIGLIPQNPADSFNPVRKIGSQIAESVKIGEKSSVGIGEKGSIKIGEKGFSEIGENGSIKSREKDSVEKLLVSFGFTPLESARVSKSYPFELSGGMLQRAAAAMGTASSPQWILADEPSKGLDEALRRQLYETLAVVKKRSMKGMIIITHDLDLASELCHTVAVMYSGQIIEMGKAVLTDPKHPYTKGLLASLPVNGMHPMRGSAPAPGDRLDGCKFAPRCPYAEERCFHEKPDDYRVGQRTVRCFLYA